MNDNTPIILYEDNHVLVVVKPQNIPTQADSSGDQDFLTYLKSYIKDKYNKPGAVFLGLVHRLDRPTGGVMVFARTSKSAARLGQQMQDGDFVKKYFAVVSGTPKERGARLTHYLVKDEVTNTVTPAPQTVQGAKIAVLDYKAVEQVGNYSLIDIKLITGRSHQARVQMQTIGHPIVGDQRYGGARIGSQDGVKTHNLALWAYELKFEHPVRKVDMVFRVFPPKVGIWTKFGIERHVNVYRPE
jgi:23S rRNA pseudouridine1911/1915/1917 synthase